MRVAGFGYRRNATLVSLAEALDLVVQAFGQVDRLAAVSGKSEWVEALSLARDIPLEIVEPSALSDVTPLTQSQASLREKNTGSVAEAVALVAAGEAARLLGPRLVSPDRRATCAVAEGNAL